MEAADYWAEGIPLDQAAWHFAPPILRKQHQNAKAARDRRRTETLERINTPAPLANPATQNSDFGKDLLDFLAAGDPVSDALFAMRESVCRQIHTGKLVATGYGATRYASNLPKRLPIDLINQHTLNWGKSATHGTELQFSSIRIARAKCRIKPPVLSKPKIGRPSMRKQIVDAAEFLWDAKRIKFTNFKAAAQEIRRYLLEKNPGKKLPCDKTIKTHVGHHFKKLEGPVPENSSFN